MRSRPSSRPPQQKPFCLTPEMVLGRRGASLAQRKGPGRWAKDPVGYIRNVLKLTPTPTQEHISRLALTPPHRVLVRASHAVGKTWWLGAMTSWFFDSFPEDSCVITTAPTSRDVKDLLWMQIRSQRNKVGLGGSFVGETAPEMRTSDDHFAKGFTAQRGESFQGRHFRYMLYAFDEAVGISPIFWETTKSMFRAGGEHIWLAICNPTDTTSQAYQEEMATDLRGRPSWHTVSMSAIDHPNIAAELAGKPAPYPAAVTLPQFESWIADWCEPVDGQPDTAAHGDFQWPPGDSASRWYRPSGMFDARATGHWPRQGMTSVWSDRAWQAATRGLDWQPSVQDLPVIGVDLASHGDDETAFHVRWGRASVYASRHSGWEEGQTAGRIKQLCQEWATRYNQLLPQGRQPLDPRKIPVVYDASGRGGALGNAEYKGDWNFIAVHAQGHARARSDYYNKRTELWFASAKLALTGCLDFSRLDGPMQTRLRQELMAVKWKVALDGRCRVEDKDDTKKRIKRSPDVADAANLAYWFLPDWEAPGFVEAPRTILEPGAREAAGQLRHRDRMGEASRGSRLFGRNGG